MNIRRAYGILLRLYPRGYRAQFGSEMLAVFDRAAEEKRQCGRAAFFRFVLSEAIGLVKGATIAWIAPANVGQSTAPDNVREAERRIELDISGAVYAIAHHDFPKARFYADEERKDRANLILLRKKYKIGE